MQSTFNWNDPSVQKIRQGTQKLETQIFGPPPTEMPTIVLLHEGLGCVALWRDFPERLAALTGCGVFAWSRAGYGQSDPCDLPRPLDYMTGEATETLPDLLDQIGVERGILLGHSDGATIAAIHSGTVIDARIAAQILIAPHFFTEKEGLSSIAAARSAYQSGDLKHRLEKYHSNVDVAFNGWCDAWLDPGFKSWNVQNVIERFKVPTLAIQGDQDPYGTLKQIEVIQERSPAPVAIRVIPECQHAPHLEQPEETLSAINDFVTKVIKDNA